MAESFTTESKIAHFLRLAEDEGATQDERDLAAAQAERLMLKHGIDRATAEARDCNVKVEEKIIRETIFFGGAYAEERMQNAHRYVGALHLQGYINQHAYGVDEQSSHGAGGRETKGIRYYIVGFESDVHDAVQLIRSLDLQGSVAVQAWARVQKKTSFVWRYAAAPERMSMRKGFLVGFGSGASKRISESRETIIEEAASGTALVLMSREQKVADYYDGLGLGKARRRGRSVDYTGYSAGQSAGYNANTGGRGIGAGQRGIGR